MDSKTLCSFKKKIISKKRPGNFLTSKFNGEFLRVFLSGKYLKKTKFIEMETPRGV